MISHVYINLIVQSSVKSIRKCKKSLYNQQMLHQNIRNCQYFDCLFTHYVVMSDFYLYIIQTQQIKIDFDFPIYFN